MALPNIRNYVPGLLFHLVVNCSRPISNYTVQYVPNPLVLHLVPDDTGAFINLLSPSLQFPWRPSAPFLPAVVVVIVFHVVRRPGAVAVISCSPGNVYSSSSRDGSGL